MLSIEKNKQKSMHIIFQTCHVFISFFIFVVCWKSITTISCPISHGDLRENENVLKKTIVFLLLKLLQSRSLVKAPGNLWGKSAETLNLGHTLLYETKLSYIFVVANNYFKAKVNKVKNNFFKSAIKIFEKNYHRVNWWQALNWNILMLF